MHGVRSEAVLAIAICGRPVERVVGQPAAHPGAVDVGVAVVAGVPLRAAQIRHRTAFLLYHPGYDRRPVSRRLIDG